MVLGYGDTSLEILVVSIEAPTRSSPGGDALVLARVRYREFAGAADAWVLGPAWTHFLEQLARLETLRRGEAVLQSISPGELRLRFFATDRAGHMAVEGCVGVRGADEARLEFSAIEFDPMLLPRLVAELSAGPATT